jgi:hypothetical protein
MVRKYISFHLKHMQQNTEKEGEREGEAADNIFSRETRNASLLWLPIREYDLKESQRAPSKMEPQ